MTTTEKLRSTVKVCFFINDTYQIVKYTKDLLYDKTNIDFFNICEGENSLGSYFELSFFFAII